MKIYYGTPSRKEDCTEKLRSLSRGGKVMLYKPYSEYLEDIAPNILKTLFVECKEGHFTFPENTVPLYIDFNQGTISRKGSIDEFPYSGTGETVEFYYGTPQNQVNITEKILPLVEEELLKMEEINYNSLLDNPEGGEVKVLRIESPYFGTVTIEEGIPFVLSLKKPSLLHPLKIVYFINTLVCPGDYLPLLTRQMESFKQSGVLEVATLFIEASTGDEERLRREISLLVPQAQVNTCSENLHEYPGIKKVWELSRENPESFILYFHSKGITRAHNPWDIDPVEDLFKIEFIPLWWRWIYILSSFPSIDKVGIVANREGFAWYNCFLAKGEYLSTCEEPILTNYRYYYENWLAKTSKERTYKNFFNVTERSYLPWLLLTSRVRCNIGMVQSNGVD